MNRASIIAGAAGVLGSAMWFWIGYEVGRPSAPLPPVLTDDALALVKKLKLAVPEGKYGSYAEVIIRSDAGVVADVTVDYRTIASGRGKTLQEARDALKFNSEAVSRALSQP